MQEETLQPEFLETEDTGIKQVHTANDQDFEPVEAQKIGDIDIGDLSDSNDSQAQDDGTNSQLINQEDDLNTPDNQMSKASQENNYCTAIDADDHDDTIQFGNPITQPFLSRSIRVPITEVGCLSFTQIFQDYLQAYPPPSQADAYFQIQAMAQ